MSLSLRFQHYKNIPYVCPCLLLNQTELNTVPLRIAILLFATYFSSFTIHICYYCFMYFLHTAFHGKTTNDWHTDDIQVHTSNIRMLCYVFYFDLA